MRRAGVAAALLALVVGAGCGGGEAGAPTSTAATSGIELRVVVDDGEDEPGSRRAGMLTCRGDTRAATGRLYRGTSAATLCTQARGLRELLTTPPEKGRPCTQVYGGPKTARVTGTIDGRKVDRRFTRRNGCEIADFRRAAGLLLP